jgi:hypothetical protein
MIGVGKPGTLANADPFAGDPAGARFSCSRRPLPAIAARSLNWSDPAPECPGRTSAGSAQREAAPELAPPARVARPDPEAVQEQEGEDERSASEGEEGGKQ